MWWERKLPHSTPSTPFWCLCCRLLKWQCNDMKIWMISQLYYAVITDTVYVLNAERNVLKQRRCTQTTYTHPHTERCLWEFSSVVREWTCQLHSISVWLLIFLAKFVCESLSAPLKVVKSALLKGIINRRETQSDPHTPTESRILQCTLQTAVLNSFTTII